MRKSMALSLAVALVASAFFAAGFKGGIAAKAATAEVPESTVLTAETLNAGTTTENPWKQQFDYWSNASSVTYTAQGVEIVGTKRDNAFNIINGPMSIADGAAFEIVLNLPTYENGARVDSSTVYKPQVVLYSAGNAIGASMAIWGDSYAADKEYVTSEFTVGGVKAAGIKLPKSVVEKGGEGVKLGFTVEDGWYAEVYDETTGMATYAPVLDSAELDTALKALTAKEITRVNMKQIYDGSATKTHVFIQELNGQNLCLNTENKLEIKNSFNASSLKVDKDAVFLTGKTYSYELIGVEANNATINTKARTTDAELWQFVHAPLMGDIGWNSDSSKGDYTASGVYLTLKKAGTTVGNWSCTSSWGNEGQTPITFEIPQEVGKYTLEVKLLTAKGNVTVQTVEINAVTEPHILLNSIVEGSVYEGQQVVIPTGYLCGADGESVLTDALNISVTLGEEEVEIVDGKITAAVGTYKIVWSVAYEDKNYTKKAEFTVLADGIKSIAVTSAPTKTQYIVGESFDPQGMVITATYESGKTEIIEGYTIDKTVLTAEDKSVVISYAGKKTVVSLTVSEAKKEETKKKKGGCSSVAGLGALTAFTVLAGLALYKKRK